MIGSIASMYETASGFAHLRKGREIILPSKAERGFGKESYNVSVQYHLSIYLCIIYLLTRTFTNS